MDQKRFRGLPLLVGILAVVMLACGSFTSNGPSGNDEVVEVVANTSLGRWLEEAVAAFNEAEVETADGKPVYVQLSLVESGEAVIDIVNGEITPDLWLPEEVVWANILADQGITGYQGDCVSVASSPLVIAMWRPVAESLGWPGLEIGWIDVGSLAADPSLWNYYSGGLYGDSLRIGHTHPGLSGSGASTLLALVQAAELKSDAVTVEDINKPIVQASVSAFESAVSTFSTSTASLGQTMNERGISYLGAAVMYESDAISGEGGDIVPIYPLEGTFVATHPACINSSADPQSQEAAALFRDYLREEEAQQLAVSYGLRPVNSNVSIVSPLDEAHGVDLSEPMTIFQSPSVETVYAVQDLWQSARKEVNLVMLLDVSGSMEGGKIDNMLDAAVQFVNQMGDDDTISIIAFSDQLLLLADFQQVGPARNQITSAIEGLEAGGDTALYDAIGEGAVLLANSTSPDSTNAMVVLSDGQDTYSFRYFFDQSLIDLAASNDTTVFAIAYGDDADEDILSSLALGAQGNFYRGDEASIVAIYDEMSAAFGGAVGVGR
ncbi:MAG: VWA domain-containing protein [Anaerolineae bacterium]|nr:MAG: VWA domain-containing protein [Anaerolineae bacterium]